MALNKQKFSTEFENFVNKSVEAKQLLEQQHKIWIETLKEQSEREFGRQYRNYDIIVTKSKRIRSPKLVNQTQTNMIGNPESEILIHTENPEDNYVQSVEYYSDADGAPFHSVYLKEGPEDMFKTEPTYYEDAPIIINDEPLDTEEPSILKRHLIETYHTSSKPYSKTNNIYNKPSYILNRTIINFKESDHNYRKAGDVLCEESDVDEDLIDIKDEPLAPVEQQLNVFKSSSAVLHKLNDVLKKRSGVFEETNLGCNQTFDILKGKNYQYKELNNTCEGSNKIFDETNGMYHKSSVNAEEDEIDIKEHLIEMYREEEESKINIVISDEETLDALEANNHVFEQLEENVVKDLIHECNPEEDRRNIMISDVVEVNSGTIREEDEDNIPLFYIAKHLNDSPEMDLLNEQDNQDTIPDMFQVIEINDEGVCITVDSTNGATHAPFSSALTSCPSTKTKMEEKHQSPSRRKPYCCSVCNKRFLSPMQLRRHSSKKKHFLSTGMCITVD